MRCVNNDCEPECRVADTQTETGMDGGAAAAKEEYELQLEMKEKKIP